MQWLDSYVTAGLGPKDILRAMTVNAARALGVENTRGAIRPNLAADIVATAVNPLDDIQALKRVAFVMKAGRIVRQPR
jgi:imidazolonepropionase-like amidohydrolase